jgi:hypothetical protein
MSKEFKGEKICYEPSRLNNGEFIPRIAIGSGNTGDKSSGSDGVKEEFRDFQADDMPRVLDFEHINEPPPSDAVFGHLEFELDGDETVTKFPKRYFVLRGSFIFYFAMENVDGVSVPGGGAQRRFQHQTAPRFKGPPLGVIPLGRTVVEFPPGGRRCFREHSKTDARHGYEMMIRHMVRGGSGPTGTGTNKRRAPAYMVCDTNTQRESWKKSILIRADAHLKDTELRPAGVTNIPESTNDTSSGDQQSGRKFKGRGTPSRGEVLSGERRIGGNISVLAGVMEAEEQKDIDQALEQFGNSAFFEESEWVNLFFENHDEYESMTTSRKMERWQTSIKKGLRGAVLEQYEYFVEASKEMTIMGREIATLKELVSKQVETVESMKNVSFELGNLIPNKQQDSGNSNPEFPDDEDELYSSEDESDVIDRHRDGIEKTESNDSWGDFDAQKSPRSPSSKGRKKKMDSESVISSIEVPSWLDDVVEEISAFIKECRYSDATDLLLKAKTEINEITNQVSLLLQRRSFNNVPALRIYLTQTWPSFYPTK